jgi:hypothetical protein
LTRSESLTAVEVRGISRILVAAVSNSANYGEASRVSKIERREAKYRQEGEQARRAEGRR